MYDVCNDASHQHYMYSELYYFCCLGMYAATDDLSVL